jgi:AcrR family transcriptional regulator
MRTGNLKSTDPETAPRRGRPRSERARAAILRSALDLAMQRGVGRLTMDAIARRAGVSKETLYRWWRSKGEVLLEAVAELGEEAVPIPDTSDWRTDLRAFMDATSDALDPSLQRVLRALAAEAAADPRFAERVREQFLARRRTALAAVLGRGVERGDLSATEALTALDLVFGSLWYRLIFAVGPLDRSWAEAVADAISRSGDLPIRATQPPARP